MLLNVAATAVNVLTRSMFSSASTSMDATKMKNTPMK